MLFYGNHCCRAYCSTNTTGTATRIGAESSSHFLARRTCAALQNLGIAHVQCVKVEVRWKWKWNGNGSGIEMEVEVVWKWKLEGNCSG